MIDSAVRTPHRIDPLTDFLGPAEVLETGPSVVRVRAAGITTEAQLALAFAYEPAVGDLALVVAKHGKAYVIGILSGHGTARLAIPGDVEIHAVGGRLRLRGDEGVDVDGEDVRISAKRKLRVAAEHAVSSFESLTRRVRGLFSSQTGDKLDTVDRSRVDRAKEATILTEETMLINGREIHLG